LNKKSILAFVVVGLMLTARIVAQENPAVDDLIRKAVNAQKITDPEPRKFSQAKSLENAGLADQAEKVYRDLNTQYPGISKYFRPLRDLLKKKEDYAQLEIFSLAFVNANPEDGQGWVDLGELYIWWDKSEKWKSVFDRLIANPAGGDNTIKMIIGRLVSNGLTEEAISYLRQYRTQTGDPHFYSLEMGTYFSMQMSWENGLDEYLNYLSANPANISIISERILSMPDDESIQSVIRPKLETSTQKEAKFILADLYFKNRNFQKAYSILKENDAGEDKLLEFGGDLVLVKQYDLADSVLNDILLTSKNEKTLESAIFKIATIYEDRTLQSLYLLPISGFFRGNLFFASPHLRVDESGSFAIHKAMTIYDSLRTVTHSFEAAYRLGEIRYRALDDLDGAEIQFRELTSSNQPNVFKLPSFLRLVDIQIARGDLSGAESQISDVLNNTAYLRSLGQEAESDIRMKLTQVYFYEGKLALMDSLIAMIINILPASDDRLNDILELSGVAAILKNDTNMLYQFAEVELKIHQNKRTEAIRLLESMLVPFGTSDTGIFRYQYAQLLLLQGKTLEALEQAEFIPENSAYAPLGMIMKAEIEDYILKDLSSSVDTYLLFLEKYPDSIYYDDIRMRLREIAS